MDRMRETSRRLIEKNLVVRGESRRAEVRRHERPRRERHLLGCHRTGLETGRGPLALMEALLLFPMPCLLFVRCYSVRFSVE